MKEKCWDEVGKLLRIKLLKEERGKSKKQEMRQTVDGSRERRYLALQCIVKMIIVAKYFAGNEQ